VRISSLLMGVPHTVVLTDDLGALDAAKLGPAIERHDIFPRKSNVNFVQVLDSANIRVLTWERGAGLTLACGTGSCASAVATYKKGLTGPLVVVHLSVGRLVIECLPDGRVLMTGPAAEVFTATLSDPA
jgi:diaminopimelate epimerase